MSEQQHREHPDGLENTKSADRRRVITESIHDAAWSALGRKGLRGRQKPWSKWITPQLGPYGIREDAHNEVFNALLELHIASDAEAQELFPEVARRIPRDPEERDAHLARLRQEIPQRRQVFPDEPLS